MEAVKQFNQELSALYEMKPPISKAKMTSITKGAIRSIKYYKHVVQSVEKFIQKCRSEYKIPGLYVIDSIVRQSRHQFNPEKDVFAPRFAKNIQLTFYHLYKCSEEEKSRVIRVLNLWQKNEVFASEVIQPLFDLANPNSELSKQMDEQASKVGITMPKLPGSSAKQGPGTIQVASMANMTAASQANQFLAGDTQNIMDQPQIAQQIQQLLNSQGQPDTTKFSSNLLDDFDYSDEESSPRIQGNVGSNDRTEIPAHLLDALSMIMSTERGVQQLKQSGHVSDGQLHQLQILLRTRQAQTELPFISHPLSPQISSYGTAPPILSTGLDHSDPHMPFANHHSIDMSQPPPIGGSHLNPWSQLSNGQMQAQLAHAPIIDISMDAGREDNLSDIEVIDDRDGGWTDRGVRGEKSGRKNKDKEGRRNRRTRSRSTSRSRDKAGKRSRRDRRSRSKSRSPYGDKYRRSARVRSTSRDRRERRDDEKRDEDKRREREKKGLPPIRKGYLSVCSTTLWVGHLSKLIAEDDLSDMFGEFGEILSINTIPPRGCAFICMNRRMDAYKALKQLHKTKLHGKQMTLAWAPGKGMKDKQWKDHWDVDLGVSYIPIDKLDPQTDMALLESGGMFDEDTMPDWMRTMRGVAPSTSSNSINIPMVLQPDSAQQTSQQPVGVPTSTTSINVTTAPPPRFVNISSIAAHGIPGGPQIPGMPAAPPGLPPFGLPLGLPPPSAGLLPPPGAQPGLLPGGPGLLAAPGLPPGAPPANLLGHPRFPGIPGHLSGPPPGFPGFDVSQPPPGMSRPPLVAPHVTLALHSNPSHILPTDRDRHSSGHSVHMEIEDASGGTASSLQKDSKGDRNDREKRDRPHRESRWGGRDETTEERPERDAREGRDYRRDDTANRHSDGSRDYRDDRSDNRSRDRERNDRDNGNNKGPRGFGSRGRDDGDEKGNTPLISRLRDLAGHSSGLLQDHTHLIDGPRSMTNNLEVQNQIEWKSSSHPLQHENEDRPFCEEVGTRIPPPFINQQGMSEGNGQLNFNGPPPGILPIFENGLPHLHAGPPGVVFDGGPLGPIPFPGNNGGGHPGLALPPFGDFGTVRGSVQRGGWRGRGGPPFGGRGGNRGGFRDGPPGNWVDDVGPLGRGGGRGGRGRGGFREGPPEFNGNRSRDNWDGANRHGPRGGQRGRGGRGSFLNFGPSNVEEELIANSERSLDRNDEIGDVSVFESSTGIDRDINKTNKENSESPQKDLDAKRERKSRWGNNEASSDSGPTSTDIQSPHAIIENLVSGALGDDAIEDQIDVHQEKVAPEMTDAMAESHVHDISQTNGESKEFTNSITGQDDKLPTDSQLVEQENNEKLNEQGVHHRDAEMGSNSPADQPIATSQQMISLDNTDPKHELNGVPQNNVPTDPDTVTENKVADDVKNSATYQPSITASSEAPCNDTFSENEAGSKTPIENHVLEETQAAE